MEPEKKLYRSNKNKMLGGVCGGLGEYFAIDPTLVRLGFVALCILAGGGLLAYIIALIIMPEAPANHEPAASAPPKNESTQAPSGDPDRKADQTSSDHEGDRPTML